MTGDIDVIHHPGLIAQDIETAVAQYEKLGFIFTPLSIHRIALKPNEEPVYFGVGNRNAIFERNFLEIVGVTDAKRWSQITPAQRGPFDIDERLRLYQGLHIMHFGADDIEVVCARFKRQGIESSDVARLQRAVDTPEGERVMHALAIHFPRGANPEALIQVAQHVTPELALQPRYMQHRNGANSLTEVIVYSHEPKDLAAKYARYSGHAAESRRGMVVVNLGYSRVVVVDAEGLERMLPGYQPAAVPSLVGFTVATCNVATAQSVLREANIETTESEGRVIVAPKNACGSAVIFESVGATR
jgi:catechol 2,3-dioxygenase-like lactoylglutathione lyase family enzyme